MIDGGLNHLKFIEAALKKRSTNLHLWKRGKRKYGIENLFYGENKVEFRKDDSMSKIFLDVRDEAHRFAIKNFRSTKRKNLTQAFFTRYSRHWPKNNKQDLQRVSVLKSFQKKAIEVHLRS